MMPATRRALRFEVLAAYALGVLLPVLETLRRGRDVHSITVYVDDYLAGVILLSAAWLCTRGRRIGPAALVAAWGILTGGFYYSFFGQLESTTRNDVSGLSNMVVVVIKGALYAVVVAALIMSIVSLMGDRSRREAANPPSA